MRSIRISFIANIAILAVAVLGSAGCENYKAVDETDPPASGTSPGQMPPPPSPGIRNCDGTTDDACDCSLPPAFPVSGASIIVAVDAPPGTDTQRLQWAFDRARAGDTVFLSACVRTGDRVSCDDPLTWVVDGTLHGAHGVIYNGYSRRGPSTLRLKNFEPDLGERWDSARGRDTMTLAGPASSTPTVIHDVRFDGNAAGQEYTHNGPPPATCDGNCEPKQEGLFLSAESPGQSQDVSVECVEFENHLWIGLLAWHNVRVHASRLATRGNHNALHLGGYKGVTRLDIYLWSSIKDRVAFRGEIEGSLASTDTSSGSIVNSQVIDSAVWAVSYSPKDGSGHNSRFEIRGVKTGCVEKPDCNANVILVPRHADVQIVGCQIGRANTGDHKDRSLWFQQVGGNVRVEESLLDGYVQIHSVSDGFDPENESILLSRTTIRGAGGDKNTNSALIGRRFAVYTNQNANMKPEVPMLTLRLNGVVVEPSAQADGLLHLFGGTATIDEASWQDDGLPIVLLGDAGWQGQAVARLPKGNIVTVTSGIEWIRPGP